DSRAAGRLVRDLALPEGVVIALIVRRNQIIPPHGKTRIAAGDHVIIVLRSEVLPLVTQIFSGRAAERGTIPRLTEFPLRPNVRVGDLEEAYGFPMNVPAHWTLAQAIEQRIAPEPVKVDSVADFGPIALRVRSLDAKGSIDEVGLVILPRDEEIYAESEAEVSGEPIPDGPSPGAGQY